MLERLAHLVIRRHKLMIAVWAVLTVFGAYSAGQVSDRWLEDFSIPGYSAYEANQRVVAALGNGEVAPLVVVLEAEGDVTATPGIEEAIDAAAAANPGSRVTSWFSSGDDAYLSEDRTVAFAEIHPAGQSTFDGIGTLDQTREALERAAPAGVETHLTGIEALYQESSGEASEGPSVSGGGPDRRPRRAGDPALHLRNHPGHRDAAGDRAGSDPQHLHPDLGPDLRHRRVDHRPVPGGADRPGRGDRLRAGHDLPLPRRAAGARPRRGPDRDHAPRRPLGDRVGLDRRGGPAEPDHPAAALHPLDRDRRHADPGGVGGRGDHAAAGAAPSARAPHQQPRA